MDAHGKYSVEYGHIKDRSGKAEWLMYMYSNTSGKSMAICNFMTDLTSIEPGWSLIEHVSGLWNRPDDVCIQANFSYSCGL